MSKYVRRIIPFGSGDIPAVQRWLEDMVEKGCFSKSAACCLQSSQTVSYTHLTLPTILRV